MKLSTLDDALRTTPRDAILWLRLGDSLVLRGYRDHAREAYRRASVLRPQCLLARLKLRRLLTPSAAFRPIFADTPPGARLWEEGWLDPDWEASDQEETGVGRLSESWPAPTPSLGRLPAPIAHVRPETGPPEVHLEGLELFGVTVAAASMIFVGARSWSLYQTMIGGALLLLLARHLPATAWLRGQAPIGLAGALGLCVVLIIAAPLDLLFRSVGTGFLPAAVEPLWLPLLLLLIWLLTSIVAARRLSR